MSYDNHKDIGNSDGICGVRSYGIIPFMEYCFKKRGEEMTYSELKRYFRWFHAGLMNKTEVACAICLWQRGGSKTV